MDLPIYGGVLTSGVESASREYDIVLHAPRLSLVSVLLSMVLLLAPCLVCAGDYTMDWHTFEGGGRTSSSAAFTLSGSIGQPDAGVRSGGAVVLVSGFWGILGVSEEPPHPPGFDTYLNLTRSNYAIVISWPNKDPDWRLEYTSRLGTTETNTWTLIPAPYPTNATDCIVTERAPAGNRFYRLRKP